ncbi:MAG TPA: serine/threonine-protein kinase [Gemmatimonadales bacterium]|nr:serine/threonine-protein kinase [Gemmatimonadales bacterium]
MKFCPVCGTEYADDVKFCPRDGQTLKSANPSGDLIGQVIADRYHITKKLGEGGMGAVYLGEHVKMGRKSAIKVMTGSMSNDPDAISRFNREANNASRINHPNVCAIYDFGETPDGIIYLAMEFIEGKSLSGLLKETGPLPLNRATAILRQTADGLEVAHELGIVHRDLKPDNIMIATQAGKDLVKVVDFGIAKAVGGEDTGQKVTKTGLVVGTPEYMSPEQLSGDKLDGRSDIYSLALVYYRMITGALPFQAETSQETMIKRLTDDPMPLSEALPTGHFPAGLQPVMDKALARYPNDRYASAAQFATDVEKALAGMSAAEQGATMVVGADQFKTMVAGAAPKDMPKTRVASAADKGGAPAAAPSKSKLPLLVGAAAVVVAGVGFALKGTLFPAKPGGAAGQPDSGVVARHDSGTAGQREGGKAPSVAAPQLNQGTAANSAAPQHNAVTPPAAAPARPKVDEPAIMSELSDLQDAVLNDSTRRPTAIQKGTDYYGRSELSAKARAEAAATVGFTYMQEQQFTQARLWFERAVKLDSTKKTFLEGLDRVSHAN